MADPVVAALIRRGALARGLDPHAVLAVAAVEGGVHYGAVGDQGTSYGPFQLHVGGALPRGRGAAWANSPAGINYALDQIARVARGKRGRAAIHAIVTGFERPADPTSEIGRALGHYGKVGGGSRLSLSPQPARAAGVPRAPGAAPDLSGLFGLTRELVGLPESHYALQPPTPKATRPYTRMSAPRKTNLSGPRPPKRGKTINFLAQFAAPFGVTVTSTTSGNHVKGSFHYQGRAVDFGGDPRRMAALAKAALQHPQDFVEMFYTGPGHPGFYIKNGKAYPLSQLDRTVYENHGDHVHLAA